MKNESPAAHHDMGPRGATRVAVLTEVSNPVGPDRDESISSLFESNVIRLAVLVGAVACFWR